MIDKILCLFGFHDRERIPSKSRPATGVWSIMDGWRCYRCSKIQAPIEWPKPGRKA